MEPNDPNGLRALAVRQALTEMSGYVEVWRTHIDGALDDPAHRDDHLQRALRAAHIIGTLHQHAAGDTAALAGIDMATVARSDFAR